MQKYEGYFRSFSCECFCSMLILPKDVLRGICPNAKSHLDRVLHNMLLILVSPEYFNMEVHVFPI